MMAPRAPTQLDVSRGERFRWPLVHSALRAGQTTSLVVRGRCMWPSLRPGDRLEVRALEAGEPRVGDVVVCAHGARALAHRVIALSADASGTVLVTCRGDATPRSDAPVPAADLIGIVTSVERRGVPVRLTDRAAWASRLLARLRPALWRWRQGH